MALTWASVVPCPQCPLSLPLCCSDLLASQVSLPTWEDLLQDSEWSYFLGDLTKEVLADLVAITSIHNPHILIHPLETPLTFNQDLCQHHLESFSGRVNHTLISYGSGSLVIMFFSAYGCHICLYTIKSRCRIAKVLRVRLQERGLKHWVDKTLTNLNILGHEDVGLFACRLSTVSTGPAGMLDLVDLSCQLLFSLVRDTWTVGSEVWGATACHLQQELKRNLHQIQNNVHHTQKDSSTVVTQDEIKLSSNHNQNLTFIFNFQINHLDFNGLHSTYKVVSQALGEKEKNSMTYSPFLWVIVQGSSWQSTAHKTKLADTNDREHIV